MPNLKRDKDGLTDMQRRFVDAYTHEAFLNATRAAKLAGYSERSAYSIGHELLGKAHVRDAIQQRIEELFPNVSFASKQWPISDWWRTLYRTGRLPEPRTDVSG